MPRFALIACALAVAMIAGACGGQSASSTEPPSTATTAASPRPATTEPGGTSEITVDPVTVAIKEQIDELMIEAQQIRGLTFLEPVEVILLSDADYQARIVELLAEELTDEEVDSQTARRIEQ